MTFNVLPCTSLSFRLSISDAAVSALRDKAQILLQLTDESGSKRSPNHLMISISQRTMIKESRIFIDNPDSKMSSIAGIRIIIAGRERLGAPLGSTTSITRNRSESS